MYDSESWVTCDRDSHSGGAFIHARAYGTSFLILQRIL